MRQQKPPENLSPVNQQLYMAVIENRPADIPALIARGANPNERYDGRGHFLHLAISQDRAEIVAALLDGGADINATEGGSDAITAAYFAAGSGADKSLARLIDRHADITIKCGAERPTSPIHIAIINGRTQCVKLLAENGADLHETDEDGNNLLHDAAVNGEVASIAILAEYGVDLNARNSNGDTPAHVAGTFIKTDAAWMFKALGADLAIKNKSGRTAEDGLSEPPYHPLVLEKLSEAHARRIKHVRIHAQRRGLTP